MKRKALALVMALLFSAVAGTQLNLAIADPIPIPELPPICIRGDGNIEPSTAPIKRVGNVYTFTRDIDGFEIEVQRDRIVIDGANHFLEGNGREGLDLTNRSDITVRNLKITGFYEGIRLFYSSNCDITENRIVRNYFGVMMKYSHSIRVERNIVLENKEALFFHDSNHIKIISNEIRQNRRAITSVCNYASIIGNNIADNGGTGVAGAGTGISAGGSPAFIVGNNIANNTLGVSLAVSNCTIYHNNFVDNAVHFDSPIAWSYDSLEEWSLLGPGILWDNGREGNYWSNYTGKDDNGDGVGDTSHVIQTPYVYWVEPTTNTPMMHGIDAKDNYPLMVPFDISSVEVELPDWEYTSTSPLLSSSPEPTPSTSPSPTSPSEGPTTRPEPFPTSLVIAASGVSVAVSGVGVLVYFKKRKR